MNLCDTNVWLALTIERHAHHALTRSWWDKVTLPGSVLFCRSTQQSFLRLLTAPPVLGAYGLAPLSNRKAWALYQALTEDDRIAFAEREPPGLEQRWRKLADGKVPSPKLWMDAYLAAFAIGGGHRIVTLDAAYRQFEGLDLLLLTAAIP